MEISKPRVAVIADAVKRELEAEFPAVCVRRSYRADIDLEDEERTVITVMPDDCAFDATRSRDDLWQEIGLVIAVTAPLDAEPDDGRTLGEGWNDRIDPLVAIVERIQEIFTGGRLITADRVGDLDVTLAEAVHGDYAPMYDFDELVTNQRFLGIVNVHTRCSVPRDPTRWKGSA